MRDFYVCSINLPGYVSFFVFDEKKEAPWVYHGHFQAEEDPISAKNNDLVEYKICYALQDHVCIIRRNPRAEEKYVSSFFASPYPRDGYVQWNGYRSEKKQGRMFSPAWQEEGWELEISFWVPDERLSFPASSNGLELDLTQLRTLSIVTALTPEQDEASFYSTLSFLAASCPQARTVELIVVEQEEEQVVSSKFAPKLLAPGSYPFALKHVLVPAYHQDREKYQGKFHLYNIGAQRTKGEVVLFLDADCIPSSTLVSHALHIPPALAVLYPCLRAENFEDVEKVRLRNSVQDYSEYQLSARWAQHPLFNNRRTFYALAINKKDLLAVGGFSEALSSCPFFQWEEFSARACSLLKGGVHSPGAEAASSPWVYCQRPISQGAAEETKDERSFRLYELSVSAGGKPFPCSASSIN